MALDLTPNPDGFGAKLNRTVSLPEWDRVIAGTQEEVRKALKEFGFLESKVWFAGSTRILGEQISRWASMFLHRDNVIRLMTTPRGGRREGTWLFPDDEYTAAQQAGLSALIKRGGFTPEAMDLLEVRKRRLGTEQAESVPVGTGVLADRALNYEHVRDYQEALLAAKGTRAKKISWSDHGIFTKKLVIMRRGLPHMREVSCGLDFSVGSSVAHADAQR